MAVAVYKTLRPLTAFANAHRFDVRLFGRRLDLGMGRLVWFSPPLLASGFGAPAVAVIGIGAALVGVAFWLGRKTASQEAPNEASAK